MRPNSYPNMVQNGIPLWRVPVRPDALPATTFPRMRNASGSPRRHPTHRGRAGRNREAMCPPPHIGASANAPALRRTDTDPPSVTREGRRPARQSSASLRISPGRLRTRSGRSRISLTAVVGNRRPPNRRSGRSTHHPRPAAGSSQAVVPPSHGRTAGRPGTVGTPTGSGRRWTRTSPMRRPGTDSRTEQGRSAGTRLAADGHPDPRRPQWCAAR